MTRACLQRFSCRGPRDAGWGATWCRRRHGGHPLWAGYCMLIVRHSDRSLQCYCTFPSHHRLAAAGSRPAAGLSLCCSICSPSQTFPSLTQASWPSYGRRAATRCAPEQSARSVLVRFGAAGASRPQPVRTRDTCADCSRRHRYAVLGRAAVAAPPTSDTWAPISLAPAGWALARSSAARSGHRRGAGTAAEPALSNVLPRGAAAAGRGCGFDHPGSTAQPRQQQGSTTRLEQQ